MGAKPKAGMRRSCGGPGRKSAASVIVEPRFPDPDGKKNRNRMLPMLARARHSMPLGESAARR
jgi:hypothetical protein